MLQSERAKIFGRNTMNKLIIAAAVAAAGFTGSAAIADVVGVSWASFQEERWK